MTSNILDAQPLYQHVSCPQKHFVLFRPSWIGILESYLMEPRYVKPGRSAVMMEWLIHIALRMWDQFNLAIRRNTLPVQLSGVA